MLVGAVGCGKTTLRQRLADRAIADEKTQVTCRETDIVDTPGEYLEHGRFNHALLLASYEVDAVLLLESATADEPRIPPGFGTFFTKPTYGVVTKLDIADPVGVAQAHVRLELAGVFDHQEISALTGQGVVALVERLA